MMRTLTREDKKLVTRAKHSKTFEEQMKKQIAHQFSLPTYEHVNIEKSLIYIKYLESDEARLDEFLDSLTYPELEKAGESDV